MVISSDNRIAARVAYLGPEGTFTEEATRLLFPAPSINFCPLGSIPDVLEDVHANRSSYGVVPIENSVHGEVTTTMDAFIFDYVDLLVCGEAVVPVSFSAFRRPGDKSPLRIVISHPHAIAQCRQFIAKLGASVMNSSSTAEACKQVAESGDDGLMAIASNKAGLLYGLQLINAGVEDAAGAATRFYLVGRHYPPPSKVNKTILVLIPQSDQTGSLDRILRCFSERGINLLSIQSRPLKSHLGEYCFIVSIGGHLADTVIQAAVLAILQLRTTTKFLGSFPMWEGTVPMVSREILNGGETSPGALDRWLSVMRKSVG